MKINDFSVKELAIIEQALYQFLSVMKEITTEEKDKRIIDIKKINGLKKIIETGESAFQKLEKIRKDLREEMSNRNLSY